MCYFELAIFCSIFIVTIFVPFVFGTFFAHDSPLPTRTTRTKTTTTKLLLGPLSIAHGQKWKEPKGQRNLLFPSSNSFETIVDFLASSIESIFMLILDIAVLWQLKLPSKASFNGFL